ncbi:MAG: thiamine phosphate synthase [Bacteroidetes bacterium]|nr:thiamine phosphate synthase [Bacteroidota bacterium]
MQLFLVTSEHQQIRESEVVNELFRNGLEKLHIRKPLASEDDLKILVSAIDSDFYSRISIHSHHHLANEFGLGGIHYTEKDRANLNSANLFAKGNISISTSLHTLAEIEDVHGFDYYFFSPVFKSITKDNYLPRFSVEEIKKSLGKTSKQLIALGGIDTNTIEKLQGINFIGAAVLGAIWNSSNPVKSFIELKKIADTIH